MVLGLIFQRTKQCITTFNVEVKVYKDYQI